MRIRTIKPDFWQNETIAGLPEFTRLVAIALLNYADDHGYFMANPKLIHGNLFPFEEDSKKVPRSIQELSRVGYLELGKDEKGRDVARVINFTKHQRVDKPKPSIIKENCTFQDESKTNPRHVQDASKEEGNGMEQGKGNETAIASSLSRGSLEELRAYAVEIGQTALDGESMFHHWESNGWKNGSNPVKNWKAGIQKWKQNGWLPSQKDSKTANKPKGVNPDGFGV
jgi:hypothetical protein